MSARDRWGFDALAGDLLSELGYPPGAEDAPSGPELDAVMGELRHEVDRMATRAAALERRRDEAEARREADRARRRGGASVGAAGLIGRAWGKARGRSRT